MDQHHRHGMQTIIGMPNKRQKEKSEDNFKLISGILFLFSYFYLKKQLRKNDVFAGNMYIWHVFNHLFKSYKNIVKNALFEY